MIHFRCPMCKTRLRHPIENTKVSCPHCGQKILVPSAPLISRPYSPPPASSNPTTVGEWETNPPPIRGKSGLSNSSVENANPSPVGTDTGQESGNPQDTEEEDLPPPAVPNSSSYSDKGFCQKCSSSIDVQISFCPHCGTQQHQWSNINPSSANGFVHPHRGMLILGLGLIGFILIPMILGPIAWFLASSDLKKMKSGQMDRAGEDLTFIGWICGVVCTVWGILILFLFCGYIGYTFYIVNKVMTEMNPR